MKRKNIKKKIAVVALSFGVAISAAQPMLLNPLTAEAAYGSWAGSTISVSTSKESTSGTYDFFKVSIPYSFTSTNASPISPQIWIYKGSYAMGDILPSSPDSVISLATRTRSGTGITYITNFAYTSTTYTAFLVDANNVYVGSAPFTIAKTLTDTTAPTITLTPDTTSPATRVEIGFVFSDAASGIEVQKVADGNQTKAYFATGGTSAWGQAYIVTANGTYTFYAKDRAGNETIKTITISNIVADTAPPIPATFTASTTNPTNGSVSITVNYPSDATTKQYKLGAAGAWTNYTAPVDVSSNTTLYARSSDEAGNVSTESSIVVANIDKVLPSSPILSINGYKLTVTPGSDLESGVKETLININNGGWIAYSAPLTLNDGDYVIQAKTVDLAGNESMVTSQNVTITARAEAEAQAATATANAESQKTQAAVDTAKSLVNSLPDGIVKTDLQNRLDVVQAAIDAQSALNQQITNATTAVVNAESIKTQASVDAAKTLVTALPSGTVKTDLQNRLDAVQSIIDAQDTLIQQIAIATAAVVNAESQKTQAAVDTAKSLVNSLPDGTVKTDLQNRLDVVQTAINAQNALNQQIATATAAVVNAESVKTQASVDTALAKVTVLPSGTAKTDLINRLDAVQADINAQATLSQQIANATAAVVNAESVKTQASVDAAKTLVTALPSSTVKTDLQNRLNAVQSIIDAQNALNQQIANATTAVVNAESIKTQASVDAAKTLVDALPNGTVKTDLQSRLDAVQSLLIGNLDQATALVVIAEQTLVISDYTVAKQAVDALPANSAKDDLQTRLMVVKNILDATTLVVKAEASLNQADVDAARTKVNTLTNSPAKTALIARLDALQAKVNTKAASDLVNETEELPTPDKVDQAQQAIDKLPDSPEKDALQDQLDAVKNSTDYQISIIVDKNVRTTLTAVSEAVKKAEKYKTKTYIVAALDKLAALPATITGNSLYTSIVSDLQTRANVQKELYNAMIADQEFQSNLIKAQNALMYYEKYKTSTYQIKAHDAINLLPDGKAEKAQLQARLDALTVDAAYQDLVTKADTAVTSYEKYRTTTFRSSAQGAINLMLSDTPEHAAKKAEMQARFNAVVPK